MCALLLGRWLPLSLIFRDVSALRWLVGWLALLCCVAGRQLSLLFFFFFFFASVCTCAARVCHDADYAED